MVIAAIFSLSVLASLARERLFVSLFTCSPLRVYEKKIPHTHAGPSGIKLFETIKICIVPLEVHATGIFKSYCTYGLSFTLVYTIDVSVCTDTIRLKSARPATVKASITPTDVTMDIEPRNRNTFMYSVVS